MSCPEPRLPAQSPADPPAHCAEPPTPHAFRRGDHVQIGNALDDGFLVAGLAAPDDPLRRDQLTALLEHCRELHDAGRDSRAGSWATTGRPWSAVSHPRVLITGDGPMVDHLAATLASAGLGVERGAAAVIDAELAVSATHARETPDAVVLVRPTAMQARHGDLWRTAGIPHLPITYSHKAVGIGPLITAQGPCLHCVELYRSGRDAGWATVAGGVGDLPTPCAPLMLQAAGWITLCLLEALLRRGRWPQGVHFEAGAHPPVTMRGYPVHPDCEARWHGVTMAG